MALRSLWRTASTTAGGWMIANTVKTWGWCAPPSAGKIRLPAEPPPAAVGPLVVRLVVLHPSGRVSWPHAGIQATMETVIQTMSPGITDITATRYSRLTLTDAAGWHGGWLLFGNCIHNLSSRVRAKCVLKRCAWGPSSCPPRRGAWSRRGWWKWSMLGDGGRSVTWAGLSTAAELCAECLAFQRRPSTTSKHTSESHYDSFFFPLQASSGTTFRELKSLDCTTVCYETATCKVIHCTVK